MIALWLGLCSSLAFGDTPPPQVELRLVSDVVSASPGSQVQLLAELDVPPGWHIYWLNPGDSGEATQLELLSDSLSSTGAIRWSGPDERLILEGDVVNLAYTHQAAGLAQMVVSASAAGQARVEARARYLICRHLCAPGQASAELVLPIESRSHPSPWSARIAQWIERMPRPLPDELRWEWRDEGASLLVPGAVHLDLFPSEELETVLRELSVSSVPEFDGMRLDLSLPGGGAWAGSVLRISYADGRRVDYNLDLFAPLGR
jgi:hypothetical protein